jgi:Transposase, Mutator family
VACLRADLDDLLTCFRYATLEKRKAVRTTNAIERRFREVRRRTRLMGTFQDKTSIERIVFAVFMHENRNQGLATPLRPDTNLLTLPGAPTAFLGHSASGKLDLRTSQLRGEYPFAHNKTWCIATTARAVDINLCSILSHLQHVSVVTVAVVPSVALTLMLVHAHLRQRLLTPGEEFTLEEAAQVVNHLYEHNCIDTQHRFHNLFFHEICPLLLIAERVGDKTTRIIFAVENDRFDGVIILGDARRTQQVEMTAAIDGYQDALRMELLAARGRAPAFQEIRASGTKKNQNFDEDEDLREAIVSEEYDQKTLRPLLEKALKLKVEKAKTNVNYRGAWLGIVFDDRIAPLNHKKKRRFDPVCEQVLAGESGQYHPFSRVFFVGISRKYLFDSRNRGAYKASSDFGDEDDR